MNFSLRYRSGSDPNCVECKYEEARRANERLEQSANDDQVLTFCTEGTPFLSTATSLTDLTGGKQVSVVCGCGCGGQCVCVCVLCV